MATNDIHQEVLKKVFRGNNGKQFQLLRQMMEIVRFEATGATPNAAQQAHIDAVKEEYDTFNARLNGLLDETKLEDMV